jgi:hypothetical protein
MGSILLPGQKGHRSVKFGTWAYLHFVCVCVCVCVYVEVILGTKGRCLQIHSHLLRKKKGKKKSETEV